MSYLEISPSADGDYEVRLNGAGPAIGSVKGWGDGTLALPLAIFANNEVRSALEEALKEADKQRALSEIWTMLDTGIFARLNVQAFEIEWTSEYNDEGGYYWAIQYASLIGPDGDCIEDEDEALDTFRDYLYEVDMEREYLPDGIYRQTDLTPSV